MATHLTEYMIKDEHPERFARKLRWTGIAFLLIGIVAIILPGIFGVAVWATLGILLIVGGIAQGVYAFQSRIHKFTKLLAGLLYLATGLLLLLFPQAGIISLALVIGALFLLEGLLKVFYGFKLRGLQGSGWAIFSGILSILLAVLIWMGVPEAAAWLIGILFGVGLIVNGLSILALSSSIKHGYT